MDGKCDLRVESRFKNALLYNALHARFESLHVAAESIGVRYERIIAVMNLSASPWRAEKYGGGWKPWAVAIADGLDESPEALFPESLYTLKLPRVAVREFQSPEVLSLQEAAEQRLLPSAESTERHLELRETIDKALKALSPRQEKLIRLRYGFDGPEQGGGDVALELGVTKARIGQIQTQALRNLKWGKFRGALMKEISSS